MQSFGEPRLRRSVLKMNAFVHTTATLLEIQPANQSVRLRPSLPHLREESRRNDNERCHRALHSDLDIANDPLLEDAAIHN